MTGAATSTPTNTTPSPVWEVTYPNGTVMRFHLEWQAVQAQAVSGGALRRIDPPDTTGG